MYRLNKKALQILQAEIQRCSGKDQVGKIEQEIVIKRLEQLCKEKGDRAKLDELRDSVIDIYPQFSEKVLKQAAKANQSPGFFTKLKWVTILLGSSTGILWVVNLPYPMIRWPVANAAPILLLPSYINMDYHYREAIKNLEQADQLINQATSPADIEQGSQKAAAAQTNLNNLPVWFLGYYPKAYCNFFGCTWKFTVDEFEAARGRVARIEAIAFQDRNAFTPLEQGEMALKLARQQYEKATSIKDKENAIASWQAAIDQLDQIPKATFAGETAQSKLKAYKRDFDNARIGTFIAAAQEFDLEAEKIQPTQPKAATELWEQAIKRLNQIPTENPRYLEAQRLLAGYQVKLKTVADPRSGTYIEAAKQFALAAAKASQNPPHSVVKWEQIAKLWQKSIDQLENIRVEEPGYIAAQKLLAEYQTNLGIIETRRKAESEAQASLQAANEQIQGLIASPPSSPQQLKGKIQGVINRLKTIQTGTTAYAEAQKLLVSAQKKLQQ
ncbi:hypothetical protein NIES37_59720 [Tolypothrix tenuis PCC 7101]|uniref:Uncharacterized protein n=1 Tax=Tolypothrix tenuis PCC 7101 TaxID=231146 RepID=A0A1Z4N8D7_9CYAN|nr:hypothetical protein NIES37_59720 [Tolypothrix tenuis PCC 7101]BAZ74110.1 hypothetical protein NIES50_26810 [Aulosira laxa NIES-50]